MNEETIITESSSVVDVFSAIKERVALKPKKEGRIFSNNGQIEMDAKGLSAGIDIGGADPLIIWRPSGSKRIPRAKAMEAYAAITYSAVKVICDEVSQIKMRLFSIDPNTKDHLEVDQHDVLDLLGAPNEFQTAMEFQWMLAAHLKLAGNAFILMMDKKGDPIEGKNTKPESIFLLNPGNVRIILNKIKYPYKIQGYEFTYEGKKHTYQTDSILHMREVDPSDPYDGIGAPQAIGAFIDNDNYAVEHNRKFFINGAKIGGFLSSEYTTEPQLRGLKQSYENNHKGVDQSWKVGVLPKGVKYTQNTATQQDMDFKGLLEEFKERILMSLRVSKTILGTAESDTNRATAETADYVFSKRTIKPFMEMICSFWNTKLIPRYGGVMYVAFTDPTPEDKSFKIQELQAVTGNSPIISVNEAREDYLGKGPIDKGDTVMQLSTLVPVGEPTGDDTQVNPDAGKKPSQPAAGSDGKSIGRKLGKKEMSNIVKPRVDPARFKRDELRRNDLAKTAGDIVMDLLKKIKSKKPHEMNEEEYSYVVEDVLKRVSKVENELIDKLKKLNGKQMKDVDGRIPNMLKAYETDKKADVNEMLFKKDAWVNATIDLATPILKSLSMAEGELAAKAFGFPKINVMEIPEYQKALTDSISKMADSYQQTTLDSLEAAISDGLAQGYGVAKIADTIKDVYEFQDSVSATRLAQTESMRTANAASKAAWKKTGVVKTMKWWTGKDDKVCPYCQEMSGKEIGIDDVFFKEGDAIDGINGEVMTADYGDIGEPPLHPNCRCYLQPAEVSLT